MPPDIFPKYRHLVVIGKQRFPTRINQETDFAFHTPAGAFSKFRKQKCDDPSVRYEGPFTAEGDREDRP